MEESFDQNPDYELARAALTNLEDQLSADSLISEDEQADAVEQARLVALSRTPVMRAMIEMASESRSVRVRLWGAVMLDEAAAIEYSSYVRLTQAYSGDGESSVRQAVLENLVFHQPRPDLLWSDIADIIRPIVTLP